ncbi:MAG: serine hydrolase domain-containing protein [Planctomycetota bacterium]
MILGALTLVAAPFPAVQGDDALTRQLAARCERAVEVDSLDGLAVVVDVGGETVLARGWGHWPGGEHVGPSSVVRAEPLFDVLAAVAALELDEVRQLPLDAPVGEVLPGLARGIDPGLRIAHLMDHTSGLIGWSRSLDGSADAEPRAADLLKLVAKYGHQSAPGACFGYSESNALVLGAAIEKVTATSLAFHLENRVLKGLGLNATGFDVERAPARPAVSSAACEVGGRLVDAPTGVHPYGRHRLCSTPEELAALARALGRGEIVSPRAVGRMRVARRLDHGTPTPAGLGVNRVRLGELQGFSFGGSAGGTALHVVHYPDADLTLALVVAQESAALRSLGRDLARIALGRSLDPASEGVQLPADVAERVSGTFQLGCTTLLVRPDDTGAMTLEVSGARARRLLYLGALQFVDEDDRELTVRFEAGEGGAVNRMVLVEGGLRSEAVRLK